MAEPEGKPVATREVLERAGISRQVLYRYMQLGLVVPIRTSGTGRNTFSPEVFRVLQLIELLKEHGYTLRDIKDIVGRKLAEKQRGGESSDDEE